MCGIVGLFARPFPKNGITEHKFAGIKAALLKRLRSPKIEQLSGKSFLPLVGSLKDAYQASMELMAYDMFVALYKDTDFHQELRAEQRRFIVLADSIRDLLNNTAKKRSTADIEALNTAGILSRDIAWRIEKDFLLNVEKVGKLVASGRDFDKASQKAVYEGWRLNIIFNNLDRLEVRGRDSAGISFIVTFKDKASFNSFRKSLKTKKLEKELDRRIKIKDFVNQSITVLAEGKQPALVFTHKIAAEIGALGYNVRKLREEAGSDAIFQEALADINTSVNMLAHTRWASNGIINQQNCHPLNNELISTATGHVRPMKYSVCAALNGDIDNYLELCQRIETQSGKKIAPGITTDAKIISAMIEDYIECGMSLKDAFCRAVQDFHGSVAIAMHSTLDPGKIYLAQRGSGQSVYVGLAKDAFVVVSETYGLVELTESFYKLEGEKENVPGKHETRGQIVVLDMNKAGSLDGMKVMAYDGTPIKLTEKNLKKSEITTRDINRGEYPHFLLKEISEAPDSMRKTLLGRVEATDTKATFFLDDSVMPKAIRTRLASGKFRKIVMLGQGTAAVAGSGIAAYMSDVLEKTKISVESYKASEYCGFKLRDDLSDTLAVAVSQSGTTTDTNRAVDMIKRRGGKVIGIVNRRNSDLVYKADGTLYTSDGRDIEMAVASTKAFYSQIVAGGLLSLYIASIVKAMPEKQIAAELREFRMLPDKMEAVTANREVILDAARKFNLKKRYWATVGSGPNKVASDEIRIKLSELCYKSIASDYTEDKKHIDLSSEPLIVVCAAGVSGPNLSDTLKEVAIFKAHSAYPIVIATRGETQFEEYASAVIYVPPAGERLSFVLSTAVGHLLGYYSAVAIDECAIPLREARANVVRFMESHIGAVHTPHNIEQLAVELENPRRRFMGLLDAGSLNTSLEVDTAANIAVVFNNIVLGGHERRDSKSELNIKPLQSFITEATRAISEMTRPIDAIKHQAKTVTVGISRIEELPSGRIFNAIKKDIGVKAEQLSFKVINTLEGLDAAVSSVLGYTLYRCDHFDALGQPDDNTTIVIEKRGGISRQMVSRTKKDGRLRGTKRSVVEHGRVFFGMGVSDGRSILIFPVMEKGIRRFVLLLHVEINNKLTLADKISVLKAYRNLYEEIKDVLTEVLPEWKDSLLEKVSLRDILSMSPRELAAHIAKSNKKKK